MRSPRIVRCLMALCACAAFATLRAQDGSSPTPPASAPSDQTPPPRPRRNMAAMYLARIQKNVPNVTDDQVTKIKAILEDSAQQMKTLRQDDSLSDDDRRTKMEAIMKSIHDQVRAVLTPDQQKAFDAMPPMRPRRGQGGEGAPPPPPPSS